MSAADAWYRAANAWMSACLAPKEERGKLMERAHKLWLLAKADDPERFAGEPEEQGEDP